ncbi:rod shape-determining protein MreD [Salsuginibacillus halophilus]|uniref:Rod shape-determining protein MreD n=1 Tax=Salsuginibacillus halophilus TaxID=517424 RepID=A0A2P8HCM9_9BACI|nr:rod shape-determining protein MreD [Salsuginibacillus halophilus]PSL43968.1 rod shape-determining protein MreD [Salsuginibacillus halophilus]
MRYLPFLIVFTLFLIEGTWYQMVVPHPLENGWMLIPRFTIVTLIICAIFRGPVLGMFYGLSIGLLYDFIYTDVLGIYMFSAAFTGYLFAFKLPQVQRSFVWILIVSMLGFSVFESLVYVLHLSIGTIHLSGEVFFYHRLLPSLGLNALLAMLLIYPMRKLMRYLKLREQSRDEAV